jgi:ABC-type branched-subunit amino acid transport system permease subunit
VVAVLLGSLTLRLSGTYLPLGTIAWGMSLYFLFGTMESLGGHTGLTGIPPISLFGYELRQGERVYYLIWPSCSWRAHHPATCSTRARGGRSAPSRAAS